MKKLALLIIAIFAFSCSVMEPATSYSCHRNPKGCECVGNILYIVEKQGYSIVTVDSLFHPVYIKGELPKNSLGVQAFIWDQYSRKGDLVKSSLICNQRRYVIDQNPG